MSTWDADYFTFILDYLDGDGREGHAAEGPYDVIYVGGAVHHYPFKVSTNKLMERNRFCISQ